MAAGRTKKFINAGQDCVDQNLEGLLYLNPGLRRLRGHRVIVRADLEDFLQQGKVSVLTGGGSGHEPAFTGYVGKGMACATVQGAIFASPGPSAILAGIRAVGSHGQGVIIIVNNYTGDRLNFGIAMERAKMDGIRVAMVMNSDDCAMVTADRSAGRRGLAGIIFLLKVAGGLAEEGRGLDEIVEMTKTAAASMGTLGVCLSPCSVPGGGLLFNIGPDDMEIGLGLHGEAGVQTVKMMTAHDTVDFMITHMTNQTTTVHVNIKSGDQVAVLLNNLGGTSDLEMNIVAREVILNLEGRGVRVRRAYVHRYATSQEMAGMSITILHLDPTIERVLDREVDVMSWMRPVTAGRGPDRHPAPELHVPGDPEVGDRGAAGGPIGAELSQAWRPVLYQAIRGACEALLAAENEINLLDSRSGDGDCGSTLASGARALLEALGDGKDALLSVDRPQRLLLDIAGLLETVMGGCSGALYSLFFTAAAQPLAAATGPTAWLEALQCGIEAIQLYGGAEPGDRTMIDALHAAQTVLQGRLSTVEPLQALEEAVQAADEAVQATTGMLARAGRASYVSPANLRQPDPGARGVAVWLRAVSLGLRSGTV